MAGLLQFLPPIRKKLLHLGLTTIQPHKERRPLSLGPRRGTSVLRSTVRTNFGTSPYITGL